MAPEELVDSHFHVVDPAFPFARDKGYCPNPEEMGTLDDFWRMSSAAGVRRAIAVQPSGYAYDNSALLNALRRSDRALKGIVMLPLDTPVQDMLSLGKCGVIGVRINLTSSRLVTMNDPRLKIFLENIRQVDWWLEVQCRSTTWQELGPRIEDHGVKVLVDHLGLPDPALGINQPGFRSVLELGHNGTAAIKLSGLFRVTKDWDSGHALLPYVDKAIEAFGASRCVWGSDWPFLNTPWTRPNYSDTKTVLSGLLGDDVLAQMVFRENAIKLFGFEADD